jgi:hypothetical protein
MASGRERVRRVRGKRVGVAAATIAAVLGATASYAAVPANAATAAPTVTISRASVPCALGALELIPLTRNKLAVSGRIDGAVPGQSYFFVPLSVKAELITPAALGVADASGTVQFTDRETSKELAFGTTAGYQIQDSTTAAVATGSTPIELNPNCPTLASGTTRSSIRTNNNISVNQQSDGNLVMRIGSRAVWSTGTAGHPGGAKTTQQIDGNLVLRATNGRALWSSGTGRHSGVFRAILQTDGNLVIRDTSNRALWSTGVHLVIRTS